MNFAVVEIAGKQYLVQKNDIIQTPKIPGAAGDEVTFSRVLLHWNGKKIAIGYPYLDGFAVEGKIVGSGRGPKIIVYKFKKRKDSHRKLGHRQDFSTVEIDKLVMPGKGDQPPPKKKSAEKVKPPKKPSPASSAPGKPEGRKEGEKKAKEKPPKKPAGKPKPSARQKKKVK